MGIGIVAVLEENACRDWWLKRLHPDGACCPGCKQALTTRVVESWRMDATVKCTGCGTWFNNRTGTVLSSLQGSWQQLLLFLALWENRAPSAVIAKSCEMSVDTVARLKSRLGVVSI
jgi:transposase-like protein